MGKSYLEDAYKDIVYKHPDWKKTAEDYEAGFAANLSRDPIVKEAARGVLTKLSKMLNTYYDVQKFKKEHPEEAKRGDFSALYDFAQESLGGEGVKVGSVLEEALLTGRENRESAGQIGNKVLELSAEDKNDAGKVAAAHQENQEMLDEVINGDGNLREQMALLYNGFFRNGGRTKEEISGSRSFKNMMANITREDALMMNYEGAMGGDAEARELNPDFSVIDEQSARKDGGDIMSTLSVVFGVKNAHDKRKGRGNAFSRFLAGLKRVFKWNRSPRRYVGGEGLGEQYYNHLGLELSDRERAYATKSGTTALQWKEGGRVFEMPEPVTAEGMLNVAGYSGTALRMLAAYRMMGADKKELLYFRLALIGWMCSSRDHSLFEVFKGSHNAGVKGYEDLSDAVSMYSSVDPLSPAEIREQYAPNREYPQETIYRKIVQEAGDARREKDSARDRRAAEKNPDIDYQKEMAEIRARNWQLKQEEEELEVLKEERRSLRRELESLTAELKTKQEEQGAETAASQRSSEIEALQNVIAEKQAALDEKDAHYTQKNAEITEETLQIRGKLDEFKEKGFTAEMSVIKYDLFSSGMRDQSSWENYLRTDDINAQDMAMNVYTTSAFRVMNNSQKYGAWIGNYILYHYTNSNGGAFKNSKAEELENKALMDKVLTAIRLTNRIAQDTLAERQEARNGERTAQLTEQAEAEQGGGGETEGNPAGQTEVVTMRGGKTPAALFGAMGSTFTTRNLTSTTTSLTSADNFYTEHAAGIDAHYPNELYNKRSIMEFHLKNLCGADISASSQYEGEKEVLVPSNVVFRVVQPLTDKVYDGNGLHPLSDYSEEQLESIRNREMKNLKYRMRKHVVIEAVANNNSKHDNAKYRKQRASRNEKRKELQERVRAFEALQARRREAADAH